MLENTGWLHSANRIGFGLLAMFGALTVADFIPSPFENRAETGWLPYFMPIPVWAALETSIAALIGAYVARVPFAGAAAVLTTIVGLLVLKFLQYVVEPAQTIAYTDLLSQNVLGIGISILGAVIGAEIGLRLGQAKSKPQSGLFRRRF